MTDYQVTYLALVKNLETAENNLKLFLIEHFELLGPKKDLPKERSGAECSVLNCEVGDYFQTRHNLYRRIK